MTPMLLVPPAWIMVLLHLVVSVIPKWTSRDLEGPRRRLSFLIDEHREQARTSPPAPNCHQGQAHRFPHG